MEETLPVPECCKECDFLYPKTQHTIGKQCAEFGVCTTHETCGVRACPTPFIPKEKGEKEHE